MANLKLNTMPSEGMASYLNKTYNYFDLWQLRTYNRKHIKSKKRLNIFSAVGKY